MRKTGIFLLTALFAMSSGMAALAAETEAPASAETGAAAGTEEEEVYASDEVGAEITLPKDLVNGAKGLLLSYPLGAIDEDHHVYMMTFVYYGMDGAEAEEILCADEPSRDDYDKILAAQFPLTMLFATDVGLDAVKDAYEDELGDLYKLAEDKYEEVGSADGYTFYTAVIDSEDYLAGLDKEYAEEYKALEEEILEAAKNGTFREPADEAKELDGKTISFTTTDLEGNTVTSDELFSKNEITMLNCWGTWCPSCLSEMEELAEIHSRMQEKGCGIVGLEAERVFDEETYKTAAEMLEEFGTNYPNVLMPEQLSKSITGYPTSIFVNKEGKILGIPIVGAQVDQYEKKLDGLLNGENETEAEASANTEADGALEGAAASYVITVEDGNGPVEDVMIQFCDDSSCRFNPTDADGKVIFPGQAGKVYDIHVLEVPDGYQDDETVYKTQSGSNEVAITLKKAE